MSDNYFDIDTIKYTHHLTSWCIYHEYHANRISVPQQTFKNCVWLSKKSLPTPVLYNVLTDWLVDRKRVQLMYYFKLHIPQHTVSKQTVVHAATCLWYIISKSVTCSLQLLNFYYKYRSFGTLQQMQHQNCSCS